MGRRYQQTTELNGHVTDDVTWPWKVKAVTPIYTSLNISKSVGDRVSVSMMHLWEIVYGESNGHVVDDVTCPWKVKVTIWIDIRLTILKTVQDSRSIWMEHLHVYETIVGVEWSLRNIWSLISWNPPKSGLLLLYFGPFERPFRCNIHPFAH